MINLDALLPDLERAVHKRVESKALSGLDSGDLRDLVYKLVERSQQSALEPHRYFTELVEAAAQRFSDMHDARAHNVTLRVEMLRQLLRSLRPVLPALLSPMTVEVARYHSEDERRTYHPILWGLQILNGEKYSTADGVKTRKGRSFWIVAIPGEEITEAGDARYAIATHSGHALDNGAGHQVNHFAITKIADIATELQDEQIVKVIRVIHERLVALTKSRKVEGTTDEHWRVATLLDKALTVFAEP